MTQQPGQPVSWDLNRDGSYTGGDYGFGDQTPGDVDAGPAAAQIDGAFAEQLPGDPHPGAELPDPGRFTYPYLRGPGGSLTDD
jgi:hypothetical protein